MPEIPVAGFLLEAFGAVALALMLSSFQKERPRPGVQEWSLGLWALAAGLAMSIVVSRQPALPLRVPLVAVAYLLAYWSVALVLLGTWARWHDEEPPRLRRRLLVGLAFLALATTLPAPLLGSRGRVLRTGTSTLLTMAAHLTAGVLLLRAQRRRSLFGARVLGFSFLGQALEDGLFLVLAVGGNGVAATPGPDLLVQAELVLLMLTGVGMVSWLLEEERESAVQLQEALHRREALTAMGTLVGGVAHEVRNPLFGITATLDALEARFGGNGASESLVATLREQVRRLNGLMTDLLDYGRPIATDLTRRSVSAVARRAMGSCDALSREAEVRVELGAGASSDEVPMDEARLMQVFQNLVQNAIEHTPKGGRVAVDIRAEARRGRAGVRCTVRDSGPGFDPTHLPRVFEPFFSGRRGGTGLGLSIVHRIVEQHSGQVDARNHPDGGGTVTVWLPASSADAAQPARGVARRV
jgi:signal transduction histidine kinase